MGCCSTLCCRILSPREARLEAQRRINVQHRSALDIFSYEERVRNQKPVVHEWFPVPVDWSVKHPGQAVCKNNPWAGSWNNRSIHFSWRSLQEVCQSIRCCDGSQSDPLKASSVQRMWKLKRKAAHLMNRFSRRLFSWIFIFCVILLNMDIVHWHCNAIKRSQQIYNECAETSSASKKRTDVLGTGWSYWRIPKENVMTTFPENLNPHEANQKFSYVETLALSSTKMRNLEIEMNLSLL